MPLPLARTVKEAHLYIELHACECGESEVRHGPHGTGQGDGYWTSEYDLTCVSCGAERKFVFRAPDSPALIDGYGGPEPSEIIDAGQWLILADLVASRVPVEPVAGREALDFAVAAMEEILKFVPGQEPFVPDSAFWTPEGRAERDKEPGRFWRPRLEIVVASYRQARAELG